ncbi:MAG: carboxypeptidase-like regulatory domain-containing protein, partial [Terracidiphilus sp.]
MSMNFLSTLVLQASRKTALRGLSIAFLGVLALLVLPCRMTAQLDTGGITGTVTDPAGAVVVGARITLTNDATNVKLNTVSTSTGTYVFDDLRPGTYSVKAEASGFKIYAIHGVEVHVQKVLTLDIPLATGNVSQSVTVTAAAPLLEAENAQIGQTITNEAVNDMPLVTRDWGALAQLSAGVSTDAPSNSSG